MSVCLSHHTKETPIDAQFDYLFIRIPLLVHNCSSFFAEVSAPKYRVIHIETLQKFLLSNSLHSLVLILKILLKS